MSKNPIVFADLSFPHKGQLPQDLSLLSGIGVLADADSLGSILQTAGAGTLVNLHAPYFPKEAWPQILDFFRRGGNLVSIGGAPFKHPVRLEDGKRLIEPEQTGYHQQLHIHEALRVDGGRAAALHANPDIPLLEGDEWLLALGDTWNLVPHVTKSSDHPHQMGSAGPMDTRIYPLVRGISPDGREVSAPAVLWENAGGPFQGSRWLFVGQPVELQPAAVLAIKRWADFVSHGVTELWLKPNYAAYAPGERASLMLQAQRLTGINRPVPAPEQWSFAFAAISESSGETIWRERLEVEVSGELNFVPVPLPFDIVAGMYRITCEAISAAGERRLLRQAFWGHDGELLANAPRMTRDRDYFIQDGVPLPVVGMTYMASDVARKFLQLPNAAVWDRDMAQMKKAGINWIRTGIWTAYRHIMLDSGHASEEALRSIDAFLMTAAKHRLHVTFTFFSFTPETWEGTNPYLDPRSVEAQKRFIRSIVSRHRNTVHVDWDLINEPSMFDPPRIFSEGPRSARDPYERKAFAEWLEKRHGSIASLQEKWNMTPEQLPDFAAAVPPEEEDINFSVQDIHSGKKGTRWLDYCLFSMDMHNAWASELRRTIQELCPGQLVTVGQDEALGAQRPSPYFYGEAVDYTTVHSWWLNDDLLWDGLFAKTADKPNLIQETGIMYVETPNGQAKRSEYELRCLLERKYAYAFASGGAGAIHWIWNTNYYMNNANESHIGALRADGTEKPEADVSYDFGRFMAGIRHLFADRSLPDIAVVFPYSNDFSNRKLAYDATTRATRALAYELKLPFRGTSEYHLDDLLDNPAKLIILPSPHNFDDGALLKLLAIVGKTGATLLATGPLGLDAYWRYTSRADGFLGKGKAGNVRREERLIVNGKPLPVSFGRKRIAELVKETREAEGGTLPVGDELREAAVSKGRLLWSPLPVELNDRVETVAELYRYAAETAGAASPLEWIQGGELSGVYGTKLSFGQGNLFIFVSESAWDADIAVRDTATGRSYAFRLEEERSVLFATDKSGRVLAVYRPGEVQIRTDGGGEENVEGSGEGRGA